MTLASCQCVAAGFKPAKPGGILPESAWKADSRRAGMPPATHRLEARCHHGDISKLDELMNALRR